MPIELQLTPFEKRDGVKYKIIQITDVTFHTNQMSPTSSIGEKVKKSFVKNAPGRAYNHINKEVLFDQKAYIIDYFKNDPEFVQYVQDEEKKGYKILLGFPKEGIPNVLGKDTIDFMNSVKGKRILRRLYKNRPQE